MKCLCDHFFNVVRNIGDTNKEKEYGHFEMNHISLDFLKLEVNKVIYNYSPETAVHAFPLAGSREEVASYLGESQNK